MLSFNEPLWDRAGTCCFTGHRPNRLPSGYRRDPSACAPLRSALREAILQAVRDGFTTFVSGMALGVDTWAAEEVLALKAAGQPLRLIAALPCPEQDARWGETDRQQYRALLERADDVFLASDRYTPYCMGARNRWMTAHSSRLIAVFDGGSGGTANTVRYADEQGLEIVRIDPGEARVVPSGQER